MVKTFDPPKVSKKFNFKNKDKDKDTTKTTINKTKANATNQKPMTSKQQEQEHLWKYQQSCGKTSADAFEVVCGINENLANTTNIETEIIGFIDPALLNLPISEDEEPNSPSLSPEPKMIKLSPSKPSEKVTTKNSNTQRESPAPKVNQITRESPAPETNKETEESPAPNNNESMESPGRMDRPSYKDTVMRNVREEPEAEEVIMNGNISRSLTLWLPDAVDTASLASQIATSLGKPPDVCLIGVEKDTRVKTANKYTIVLTAKKFFDQAIQGITINNKRLHPDHHPGKDAISPISLLWQHQLT